MTEEGSGMPHKTKDKRHLCNSDYHNPTSYIMSLETRKMIAALAREKHILVIEDGINNLLTENPCLPFASFALNRSSICQACPKTIARQVENCFCPCARPVSPLLAHLYSMNISISPRCLQPSIRRTDCRWDCRWNYKGRKEELRRRNHIISQSWLHWTARLQPHERYLRLPDYFTGKSLEICAKQAGVQVYGTERFQIGNQTGEKAVRISVITRRPWEDLEEGLDGWGDSGWAVSVFPSAIICSDLRNIGPVKLGIHYEVISIVEPPAFPVFSCGLPQQDIDCVRPYKPKASMSSVYLETPVQSLHMIVRYCHEWLFLLVKVLVCLFMD